MWARAAVARDADWRRALARVVGDTVGSAPTESSVDLALVFASHAYADEYEHLVRAAKAGLGARHLIGCSGQGVVGDGQEVEDEPALAVLVLSLPGAAWEPVRLSQRAFAMLAQGSTWPTITGAPPDDTNGWLVLADPFTLDADRFIGALSTAYPDTPISGGLASGDPRRQQTHIFIDDEVFTDGGVAVAITGPYRLETIVAQGAMPIGEAWTITEVDERWVHQIGGRPAYEVLHETLRALPAHLKTRIQNNLLAGLVVDERKLRLERGDFLIRAVVAANRNAGSVAIGAQPRVGQAIQFQLRDAQAATDDLTDLLQAAKARITQPPIAGLLCTCNGRGQRLFGRANHDAGLIADVLGPAPVAGFFCNGEIGPIGRKTFVHGFTASLALITAAPPRPPDEW